VGDIFISYARPDRARVEPLARALSQQGWSVWWDRDIPFGKTFDQVIAEAIGAARCVIVVWSGAAVQSHWVVEEAHEGHRRNILVPVQIDPVAPPLGFRRLQAADLTGWTGRPSHPEFRKLLRDIESVMDLGVPQSPPMAKPQPPSSGQPGAHGAGGKHYPILAAYRREKTRLMIGMGSLVLALLLALGLSQSLRHSPPTPAPPATPVLMAGQVDGVGVEILAVRRVHDRNAAYLELDYRITTGVAFAWHNPAIFVKYVADGVVVAPVWVSTSARILPSNGRQDIPVPLPPVPEDRAVLVFTFGEEHQLGLLGAVTE